MEGVAQITPLLKMAEGGLTATLAAMRFSNDLAVISFLEKYDAISERDRKSLSWEAIAIAAEVDTAHLLGGAIMALQTASSNMVKIIALSNHPKITQARVNFGLLPGGERDRAALDSALGFLPTPKGSTFIINPQGGGKAVDDDDEDDESSDGKERDLDHLFPSLSKTQETLVPTTARMLESGK